jgi:hypothetical protein
MLIWILLALLIATIYLHKMAALRMWLWVILIFIGMILLAIAFSVAKMIALFIVVWIVILLLRGRR